MSGEISPSCIISSLPLPSSVSELDLATARCPTRARFSFDNEQYLWKVRGAQLEVMSTREAADGGLPLIGSFDFSQLMHDKSVSIASVSQLRAGYGQWQTQQHCFSLLVALNRRDDTSILCLVDARLGSVFKSFECPFKITAAETVSLIASDNLPLTNELRCMNGVAAVGCVGGGVFIVDLCLDEEPTSELAPKQLCFMDQASFQVMLSQNRKSCLNNDQALCLPLNSDCRNKSKFLYRGNSGKLLATFRISEVSVSALHFIGQTAMLCIGFNFGGFQLYNLNSLTLECSCSIDTNDFQPPVISFAFLEPENDPKNYCYLWLIRGFEIEEEIENIDMRTAAYLYSMCFDQKEWISNYGFFYTNFQACSCRFEYPFGINPLQTEISCSSRFIDCYTLQRGDVLSCNADEDNSNLNLGLCLFAWEAWTEEAINSMFFALFDINMWYQTQMPSSVAPYSDKQLCPFLGVFSMNDISNKIASDSILRLKLEKETIVNYKSNSFDHELHYYPSSLSFEILVLSETHLCKAFYLGLPKLVVSQMMATGPSIFIDPKEYLNQCKMSGLLPFDTSLPKEINEQRKLLLTLCLENEALPLFVQVIEQWSSGEFDNIGCNCKFILDWIWERVSLIKKNIDEITDPLFNYSGERLNRLNLSYLYSFKSDLKSLDFLLKELQEKGTPTTNQGLDELNLRRNITLMISAYLRVLLFFCDLKLLPEHEETDAFGENEVAFPISFLSETYENRRKNFEQNDLNFESTKFLLIDGLFEIVNTQNPKLSQLWIKKNGNYLYPPPNLHALVVVYLLESVSFELKNALVLYCLLDIASYLTERQTDVAEKIKLFPSAFNFMPGFTKMIQGMWALDHQLYDFAMKSLIDPSVAAFLNKKETLDPFYKLQQRIVLTLTCQNKHRKALFYIQTAGLFQIDSQLNQQIYMYLLLKNQLILKAFDYQRKCRNESNCNEILSYLFCACEKMELLDKIFKLPLDVVEEDALTNYLLYESKLPSAKQMILLYFILNNNVVGAYNLLNEYKNEFAEITSEDLLNKTTKLASLINAHVAALPKSLSKLSDEIFKIEEKRKRMKFAITKLKTSVPFKITPQLSKESFVAPSHVYEAVMEQIESVWMKAPQKHQTPVKSKKRTSIYLSQNSPFLRTPLADHRCLSKTKPMPKELYLQNDQLTQEAFESVKKKSLSAKKSPSKKQQKSCDLLKVLETPKIIRKPPLRVSISEECSVRSMSVTPTSILKVKQLMRRSTSPLSGISSPTHSNKSKDFTHPKLRFNLPRFNEVKEQEETVDKNDKKINDDSCEIGTFGSVKDTFSLNVPMMDDDESFDMLYTEEAVNIEEDGDKTISDADAFNFSDPILRVSPKKLGKLCEETETSQNSFVFSPPQTRSKLKLHNQMIETSDVTESKPEHQEHVDLLVDEHASRASTPFDDSQSDSMSTVSHQSDTSQTKSKRKEKKKIDVPPLRMQLRETPTRSKSRSKTPTKEKSSKKK